jgi:flagellar biosynthesis protein FlhG
MQALSRTRVFTVASGKGGVGKSCFVANLGASIARQGQRVLLIDADVGLANLDILLNTEVTATLEQVLQGEANARDALVGIEPNLWLMPARSGLTQTTQWSISERLELADLLESLPWEIDVVLIDCGAGISDSVLRLHQPEFESLVVLTPDPTAIADAYGLIKMLQRERSVSEFKLAVNQVTDAQQAQNVFKKIKEIADRFIDTDLSYLGHIPRDEKMIQAVLRRKILLDLDSEAPAARCLDWIAKRLVGQISEELDNEANQGLVRQMPGKSAQFWQTLLGEVRV